MSLELEDRWIPLCEKLPTIFRICLVYNQVTEDYRVAKMYADGCFFTDNNELIEVTHWMPFKLFSEGEK